MEYRTGGECPFLDLVEALPFDYYIHLIAGEACETIEVSQCIGLDPAQESAIGSAERLEQICRLVVQSTGPVVKSRGGNDLIPALRQLFDDAKLETMGIFAHAGSGGRVIHCLGTFPGSENPFDDVLVTVLDVICTALARQVLETERRTNQFRRLVLQLSESENRERRRVAGLLHDDLQQTLAGAKVHVDMARRHAEGDEFQRERLTTAADLLSDVIERSRSLSHELQPTVLTRQGLGPALSSLGAQMEKTHGLTVEMTTTGSIPTLTETVKNFVYRAVQELLFNVVKHAGVDHAELRTRTEGDWFVVEVRDHGKGFDVPIEQITESSSGLGLLSLRERLEAVGGTVEIESAPGAGSRFKIRVPVQPDVAHQGTETIDEVQAISREDTAETRKQITILLVDDHAVIRQGLAMLLNEEPDLVVVGEADSGPAALDAVKRLHPDVVVMDFTMPGMDGDVATRRIKRDNPGVRIVGLSMHAESDAPERMLEAGADVYLPKTGPSDNVIAAIRRLG